MTMGEYNGERPFLTTTPGTQVTITGKMWCAGHGRMPWWLHNMLHRLRLLRTKAPRTPWEYVK